MTCCNGSIRLPIQVNQTDTTRDAFQRFRVSNPYTLFDSQNRYDISDLFFSNVAGTGSVTYIAAESSVSLNTGSSGTVIRQTRNVFGYQPGKSMLVLATFVMSAGSATQRVGFFYDLNGLFLERSSGTTYFVKRNDGTDTKVPQTSWNLDRLDGLGPSKLVLDITKVQIFWVDLEWLGAGSVRFGFVINGEFIPCHVMHHANLIGAVYMTTAILPVRYEISGTGNQSLKQICSTVISEGGYEPRNPFIIQQRGTTNADTVNLGTAGTVVPVISLRLRSDRLYSLVVFKQADIYVTSSSDGIAWYIIANGTLTGATWTDHPVGAMSQTDVTATAISGGRNINGGYIVNKGTLQFDPLNAVPIGQQNFGTSEIFTLAASGFANNLRVAAKIGWYEI
jgi:hypothetical protein